MHATHKPPIPAVPAGEPAPAQLLRQAADYLARHGWIQCSLYSDGTTATPAACASGALAIAAYGYPHPEPHSSLPVDHDSVADLDAWHAFVVTESLLEQFLGLDPDQDESDGPTSLYEWNDVDTRTAEQVITALRSAATTLQAAS